MSDRFLEMAGRVYTDIVLLSPHDADGRIAVIEAALRAAYDRGAEEGLAVVRPEVAKCANAIGRIDAVVGIVGIRPLSETVDAVERLAAEVATLRRDGVA